MTGRSGNVRRGTGRLWAAVLIGLAVGGVVGFYLGFQRRASQGYDCGPIAGMGEVIWTVSILGTGVLLLILAGVAAFTRHKDQAIACLSAIGGLAIGVAIGFSVSTPVDRCPRPTDTTEPAVLTLQVGAPLNIDVAGPGECLRDIETGGVRAASLVDDGAGRWTAGGYQIVDIALGYGSATPGVQIGLMHEVAGTNVAFRQTADVQVVTSAAADGESGAITFTGLPLLEDSDVNEPEQISGVVRWRCAGTSLPRQ